MMLFIKLCSLWDINQDKKPIYFNSQNNFTITINRKDSSRIESASVAERESIFHNQLPCTSRKTLVFVSGQHFKNLQSYGCYLFAKLPQIDNEFNVSLRCILSDVCMQIKGCQPTRIILKTFHPLGRIFLIHLENSFFLPKNCQS